MGTFGMFSAPMTAKDFAAKINKYTLMTIQPTFTVSDWAAAEPIMAEFVEATKKETGCIYYGWSTDESNNKLFCREAYIDAAAALAHLENIGALVGKLLESAATLDQIELHGPAAEVEKCKEKMDGFGTKYYAIDSGFSCMVKDTTAPEVPQTIMTIQPTFTVSDWAAASRSWPSLWKRLRKRQAASTMAGRLTRATTSCSAARRTLMRQPRWRTSRTSVHSLGSYSSLRRRST